MTAAAKHFDPIVGIDVHIVQPPGPVPPVPVPHPHTGMVLDPADYAPFIGGTVKVGGLQRAQAGTETMMIPKHIPIGGTFIKPPGNEGEVFMGSSTVAADGDAFTYLALPVLTCQDVGIPAPGRPKGSPPKSLVLPTTVVLAIPAAVNVGGSPTVSLMALGMRAGLAALGKGLKKLAAKSKKFNALLEKGAGAWKKASKKLQDKASDVMKKLGIPPGIQNRVHRAICSVTGHPVDIATGKVFTEFVDVTLDSRLPFRFERVWFSTSTYRGSLGHGWHHCYDLALHVGDDVIVARLADGRYLGLPKLEVGDDVFVSDEKFWFGNDARGYWLRDRAGLVHRFGSSHRQNGELALSSITDRHGNQMSFAYDHLGRLAEITDASGRRISIESDAKGRIASIVGPHPSDPRKRRVLFSYRYDEEGDLIAAIDPLGHATRFVYRDHLLVRETNRNGMSFYFEYDSSGAHARCIRTWGDHGFFARKLTYLDDANVTLVEDSLGQVTTYHHDGAVVHREVDPLGGVTTTKYDADYNVVSRTDPGGATTTYEYDDRCNVTAVFAPDGAVTRLEYAACDRLAALVSPDGVRWTWTYDERGRTATMVDPRGGQTLYEYAGRGLVARIDPDGLRNELQYDGVGNVVAMKTRDGARRQWKHDALGRVLETTDPFGYVRRQWYDVAGQVVRIEERDGNVREVSYDPEGNIVEASDRNRRVQFAYRGMNLLAARTQNGTTVAFEHDTEGRVTAAVNEHRSRHLFAYDARGCVVRKTDFDGLAEELVRDAAGRVQRVIRPGGEETRYRYDAGGRIAAVEYSEGDAESFRYDAAGRLIEAANADIVTRFAYDDLGRMVGQWQGQDWVTSVFDDRDCRIAIESSRGAKLAITRNASGDVDAIEAAVGKASWSVGFVRDVVGRELERHLPGADAVWERDDLGRPTAHTVHGRLRTLRTRRYAWDVDGRLAEIRELGGDRRFEHDGNDRLCRVHHDDGVEERSPDAIGNVFGSIERFDREYGRAGQVLQSWDSRGVTRYAYDARGNLAARTDPDGGEWQYAWNGAGTLRSVTRPDGTIVELAYDALRRRVAKRVGERTTRWLWDGNNPLHEWVEVDEPAANGPAPEPVTWLFEPGTFAPMARLADSGAHSIVSDHIGTPLCLVDGDGALVWNAAIDTRGRVAVDGDAALCPFRFPGQYADEETGLVYNRFRYFDPATATYLSRDPLGLRGGWLPYGYVDDPTTWFDPLGLSKSCDPNDVKGGRHRDTKKPPNDKMDSHHMPAKKSYDDKKLDPNDGPAIKMDPADHQKTGSHGSQPNSQQYRDDQRALIEAGRVDDAIQKDIDDIQSKFGDKYDDAILEMIDSLDDDFYKDIMTKK